MEAEKKTIFLRNAFFHSTLTSFSAEILKEIKKFYPDQAVENYKDSL